MATSLMEQAQALQRENQITPDTQEFDESKGVAGRVQSLTAQDSPLMQQAATRGTQAAAARGLTNSSLAAQAAQEAVIGAATPIASADAGLYQQQALTNQGARNSASASNAQIGATLGGQAMGLENSNQQQTRSLTESARQFDQSQAQQSTQFGQNLALQQRQVDAQIDQFAESLGLSRDDLALRRDSLTQSQQQFLDNLNLQKDQLAQNQSQFNVSSGQTQQQITNQASQFGQDLTLRDRALVQQQQQIDAQISQFAQQLGVTVQDLNLRRDQLSQQDRQFLDSLTQQKAELAQQQSQFQVNAGQNQQQITNQASQFGQSLAEQQANRSQQQEQFQADQQFRGMQAGLDRDNQVKLADMQAENQAAINSNGDISQAWQQMSVNIANIQNNANLDEAAKRTLIQNQMDSFGAFSRFWQSTTGVDVSNLLNFSLPPAPPPAPAPPPTYDPGSNYSGGEGGGD